MVLVLKHLVKNLTYSSNLKQRKLNRLLKTLVYDVHALFDQIRYFVIFLGQNSFKIPDVNIRRKYYIFNRGNPNRGGI